MLAEAVLSLQKVRLALAVLDGGRHALARATELAEAVIREAAPAGRADRAAGGGA